MAGDVGVDGVRIERLANHQDGFAVGIAPFADEVDVGAERHVAGHLLPDEVKVVDAEPEIRAAAGDGVDAVGWVIAAAAWMKRGAQVSLSLELSEVLIAGLAPGGGGTETTWQGKEQTPAMSSK